MASESELSSLSREIEVASGDSAVDTLTIHATNAPREHLNKYGEAYPLDKTSKY
jgi:hypothetical protein